MANNQSLPNLNESKSGFINTNVVNNVVAPDYKEQKWATVAQIGNGIVGVSNAYKNMKHTEMLAKMDNLAQQNLHKLSDATDPCQIPDLLNEANKSYDDLFKDDPYGKSFYQSDAYNNFRIKNEANIQKTVNSLNHKFNTIQAVATGNEISSDIALMNDPVRMSQALKGYESMLSRMELTAEEKFEIMSNVAKNSFGKAFSNDPNMAVAWYDASQGMYDKYGVDGAEIKLKAKNYNKALAAEKRTLENYEYTKKTREQTAKSNYYKAQYLQNPSQKDVLLTKALAEDDKVYVELSEFIRKNTPKSSQRSVLSKDLTNAYVAGGVAGADSFIDANPEVVNDPNAMSAYKNIKELNKPESEVDEILEGMEKAFADGTYEEYRRNNLASILAVDKTRTADTAYRKELNISSNADGYTIRIANSSDTNEITDIANEALSDANLTDKEKANILKYKNTRINQIENKADKNETKRQKQQKEKRIEESGKAYGDILSEENNGSEAIKNKLSELSDKLTITDKNRAIALYNKVAKEEGKEERDLLKELQEEKFNELMGEKRDGSLTQEKIDEAYEAGDISIKHKEKLEEALYKAEIKQAKQTKEYNKEEALKTIYYADANGETVDVSKLPSQDADVIKAANSVNLKNGKRVYTNEKNNIFGEMLDNPIPDDEVIEGWKNRLIEKNYMGNTELPEQWIENTLTSIRGIDQSKTSFVKNKIDGMFSSPLKGNKYSEYELELKNKAYKEALNSLADGKTPNYEQIIKDNKPTKSGLEAYYRTKDNAYYSLLSNRDALFMTKEVSDKKGDITTKTKSFVLNPDYKFSDFNSYIDNVERARLHLNDTQYKELYKPVALYLGDIVNTAKKDSSVEAYALNKLRDFMYGKGNPISNPVKFYEDYRKIMAIVEENIAGRSEPSDPWGWNNYTSAIDEAVNNYMQNTQQLNGYGAR